METPFIGNNKTTVKIAKKTLTYRKNQAPSIYMFISIISSVVLIVFSLFPYFLMLCHYRSGMISSGVMAVISSRSARICATRRRTAVEDTFRKESGVSST